MVFSRMYGPGHRASGDLFGLEIIFSLWTHEDNLFYIQPKIGMFIYTHEYKHTLTHAYTDIYVYTYTFVSYLHKYKYTKIHVCENTYI